MGDCVTVAAASLGPFDCVLLSGLWATAWLLLLPHWGRMTAICCLDYMDGRLRDGCCCLIGAVWLHYVVWTMDNCVTAASLGTYDCVMLSGLWATAWLLLLLHWGRMTALCCLDYGQLHDCCCCLIGAVWLCYVVWTMGNCMTAAAASLGPYDCVMLSGLWATAWLLLLSHRGRMTVLCCLDYGRLSDCCCCLIGAVWLCYVVWTMGDCVTAAAVSLGPYDCDMLSGLWATAWLLLLPACVSLSTVCCLGCVKIAWLLLLPACNSLRAICCLVCVKTVWLMLLPECCLLSVLCASCCCGEGVAFILISVWGLGGARLAATAWLLLLTPALRPIASICNIANAGTAWLLLLMQWDSAVRSAGRLLILADCCLLLALRDWCCSQGGAA